MCPEHFTLGASTLQALIWALKLAKISNMRVLRGQARESCQHWGLVLDLRKYFLKHVNVRLIAQKQSALVEARWGVFSQTLDSEIRVVLKLFFCPSNKKHERGNFLQFCIGRAVVRAVHRAFFGENGKMARLPRMQNVLAGASFILPVFTLFADVFVGELNHFVSIFLC